MPTYAARELNSRFFLAKSYKFNDIPGCFYPNENRVTNIVNSFLDKTVQYEDTTARSHAYKAVGFAINDGIHAGVGLDKKRGFYLYIDGFTTFTEETFSIVFWTESDNDSLATVFTGDSFSKFRAGELDE